MLKLLPVLIFLMSLASVVHPQYCGSECKYLSYHGCTVCYRNCSTSYNWDFTFNTCTQTICEETKVQQHTDKDGYTTTTEYCSRYGEKRLFEDECIKQCCDSYAYGQFTADRFEQCIKLNDEKTAAALGVLTIIGIIVGFCCCCKACCCSDDKKYKSY